MTEKIVYNSGEDIALGIGGGRKLTFSEKDFLARLEAAARVLELIEIDHEFNDAELSDLLSFVAYKEVANAMSAFGEHIDIVAYDEELKNTPDDRTLVYWLRTMALHSAMMDQLIDRGTVEAVPDDDFQEVIFRDAKSKGEIRMYAPSWSEYMYDPEQQPTDS